MKQSFLFPSCYSGVCWNKISSSPSGHSSKLQNRPGSSANLVQSKYINIKQHAFLFEIAWCTQHSLPKCPEVYYIHCFTGGRRGSFRKKGYRNTEIQTWYPKQEWWDQDKRSHTESGSSSQMVHGLQFCWKCLSGVRWI